jgi:hypothetical protein
MIPTTKTNQTNSAPPPARSLGFRLLRWLAAVAGLVALLLLTAWSAAALYFDVRVLWLRVPLAVGYVVVVLVGWIVVKRRWLPVAITAGGFALVLAWWLALQPSNDRDWQPDLAVLAHAETNGNRITLRNIRNCVYRTETDFDVRHYDKDFDLDKLRTADLFMVYWGSPSMAHTMVSFGFEGGDYVCFSIETRKEKGEAYSAVKGLFRQFELIYIVGDERDLVRLRTNYRQGEDAYIYRLRGSPEQVRAFFLNYVRRVNDLHRQPEWYSAVTQNCTTSIRMQRAAADRAPWDWRMLVNGYGNELLYERGAIATNLPLAELKQRGHINERARAADQAADFSQRIREGVPGMELSPMRGGGKVVSTGTTEAIP